MMPCIYSRDVSLLYGDGEREGRRGGTLIERGERTGEDQKRKSERARATG